MAGIADAVRLREFTNVNPQITVEASQHIK